MMRWRFTVYAISVLAATALLAAAMAAAQQADAQDHPVFIKYDDAIWQKIAPELGDEGPDIAVLHVDADTGATQLLIRMNSAMVVPMHSHSANETHTMIKGTAAFDCGGERQVLGPGGFNYIPAGHKHRAWASAGSVVFITVDGPWDINWVEGPPTKEHLNEAEVQKAIGESAKQ